MSSVANWRYLNCKNGQRGRWHFSVAMPSVGVCPCARIDKAASSP